LVAAFPIHFYHLMATPIEKALPQLVERAYASGGRVVVHGEAEMLMQLDDVLWNYSPVSFLPHAVVSGAVQQEKIALMASGDVPEDTKMLFLVSGASVGVDIHPSPNLERVFDMFDGANDAQVSQARVRWKHYQDGGYALKYIRQNDRGGWDTIKEVEAKSGQ
jgi:DNA polymerase-3 subunit chi